MTESPGPITEALPEHWPTTPAAEPVRPWWLPWPVAVMAVPLLWILPKRMGPHFAAVRWPGIIAAHLLWTLYGIACIYLSQIAPQYSWVARFSGDAAQFPEYPTLSLSQTARAPVAQVVWDLSANAAAGKPWMTTGFPVISSSADLLLWLAVVAGIEIGLLLLALLIMPCVAGGERTRRLMARSARLVLLGTTIVFPVSLAIQWITVWEYRPVSEDPAYALATALASAWFCWIVIRAGSRYSGPPEGPGWEPRKVLCEACGYALTGLTALHKCPECGYPVADSLPSNRRPTPMTAATGVFSRIPGFVRTFLQSLLRLSFYKHLAVHGEYETARRFAVWTCILAFPWGYLITILCLLPVAKWREIEANFAPPRDELIEGTCIITSMWVFITIGLLLILGGLLVLGTRLGHQPIRPLAVVVFYWSAWLMPMIAAASLAFAIAEAMRRGGWYIGTDYDWGPLGKLERGLVLAPIPFLVLMVPIITFSVYRLLRGSREIRFANA